jgi:hypothetical protein
LFTTQAQGGIFFNWSIAMPAVQSSTIAWAEYDKQTQVMEVRFHNGGIYIYSDVEPETYQNFLDAESQGKFFNRFIKDKYSTKRLR